MPQPCALDCRLGVRLSFPPATASQIAVSLICLQVSRCGEARAASQGQQWARAFPMSQPPTTPHAVPTTGAWRNDRGPRCTLSRDLGDTRPAASQTGASQKLQPLTGLGGSHRASPSLDHSRWLHLMLTVTSAAFRMTPPLRLLGTQVSRALLPACALPMWHQ